MRRIAEGFELPSDWGFFTNNGMTLDTATPLFGLGCAKYNAANVEYATAPILSHWGAYYVWMGMHINQANPASATPNWITGWRSEGTPGNVVEGGCLGIRNSKLCFGLGGPAPEIVSVGRRTLLSDTLYHLQVELWFAQQFGWLKVKIDNRTILDLVFNGVTAANGEAYLSQVWIGSLYGGGNGNCRIDDYVLNDQQPFQNQDRGWPGMLIIRSAETDVEGAYGEWTGGDSEDQTINEALPQPVTQDEAGVSETPIACVNGANIPVSCVIMVEGPITNPVFENETSVESISFTGTVPDGSKLVVDTQDHTALLLTGTAYADWEPFISGTPDWFVLAPGANSINVSGAAGNVVQVGWIEHEAGKRDSFTFDAMPAAPTAPQGTAGLVAVDHIYRMKLEGTEVLLSDKVIPGIRRSGTDYFAEDIQAHLFPDATLAGHVDRMRRDRVTNTLWNPANINASEAIWQHGQAFFTAVDSVPPVPIAEDAPEPAPQPPAPAPAPAPYPAVTPQPPAPTPGVEVIGNNSNLYVSASGSDGNSGTITSPFATVSRANQSAVPGTNIWWRGGTYNQQFTLSRSGNSWSEPVTLQNYNGETVVNNAPNPDGSCIAIRARYVFVKGIKVDGLDDATYCFTVHEPYVRLQQVEITRAANQGLWAGDNANYFEAINCHVHFNGYFYLGDARRPGYGHGFYLTKDYARVIGGLFHHNDGHGIQVYSAPENNLGTPDYNELIKVRSYDNVGPGLGLYGGRGNSAVNCITYRNESGIRCANDTESRLLNCTCTDGVSLINSSPTMRNLIGVTGHPGCLASSPGLFVNAGADDYRLANGSAAINAGVAGGAQDDFDGNQRPLGAGYDAGAYERV